MSDFFAPAIPAERILSKALRVHMVDGDGMAPELRGGRDYALIAPVQSYRGEGLYLIEVYGGATLYRVQNILGGQLRLSMDNPVYTASFTVTREQFEETVLGIVVADIKVRDDHKLREAIDHG